MSLLTPLLWSLVPSQITHILLPYLTQYLPGIFPPAPAGSPLAARNYRWAFSLVVVSYLAYSFTQSSGAEQDWYALLGVGRDAEDAEIKKAFRALSRTHHPDKATSEAESGRWILIRLAYEVLSDPTKRYAYDRFGPDIVSWKCSTIAEYVRTGILHSSGFYLVSAAFMLGLSVLGKAREGAYWRHILFVLLFYLELSLILDLSTLLPLIGPGKASASPQFRQILLLHELWTSLSIGITQLAGVWTTPPVELHSLVDQVENLSRSIATETVSSFQNEMIPLLAHNPSTSQATQNALLAGMEQSLVEWKIASHPLIRPLWQEALVKSREANARLEIARNLPLPPSPPLSPVR